MKKGLDCYGLSDVIASRRPSWVNSCTGPPCLATPSSVQAEKLTSERSSIPYYPNIMCYNSIYIAEALEYNV